MKINLSRDDMFDAVMLGVKGAILEMCETENIIETNKFMENIRQGVQGAIWQIATNATSAPCADFYDSIQKGVEKAMEFKDISIKNE